VFKLVATDLDGTLLHPDGTVTERTRRALRAVEDLGVTVVFVTGRPVRWMEDLWEHVGGHGLAVCSNGGIVYDVQDHSVSMARTIPPEVLLEVGAEIRDAIPGTTFALERTDGFAREPGFLTRNPAPADLDTGPLEQIADDRVVKLLARHEDADPELFWGQVESHVSGRVTTTWSSTGALVEISGIGVTKASTLAILCERLGVSADEVVAFGDMPNDVPMLTWAGTSYAMAGAHPLVRDAADHLAAGNAEDGVAATLESLFDLACPLSESPNTRETRG
jgi:Cof subfamily protein (haloacid dehalogenase superfamily)